MNLSSAAHSELRSLTIKTALEAFTKRLFVRKPIFNLLFEQFQVIFVPFLVLYKVKHLIIDDLLGLEVIS